MIAEGEIEMVNFKEKSILTWYGVDWYYDGKLFWCKDPQRTGIYGGVLLKNMNIPYLKRISAQKSYWENYWQRVLGLAQNDVKKPLEN